MADAVSHPNATEPAPRAALHRQLGAFVAVGAVSAVVDFGVLTLLMWLGMGPTQAKALSFVCGTTTAYLLNSRYTFASGTSKRSFVAVVALYFITFVVQVGLFGVLFTATEPYLGEWTSLVCFVVAQGIATVINFIVQRVAIFR